MLYFLKCYYLMMELVMVRPNFVNPANKRTAKKASKLFDKNMIHTGQTTYLLMSIFYLILLTAAFILMLYGEKNISNILLVIISCISFLAQFINITCNALNIENIRREKLQSGGVKYSKDAKDGLIISAGFIGESLSFLGIATALLILGLQLSHGHGVFLGLRISSLVASLFSITYGSVMFKRHTEHYSVLNNNTKKNDVSSFKRTKEHFYAEWAILNSALFISLGIYNFLYETVLFEVLDFSHDHHTAIFLKTFVFVGYACVLSMIFLSQICGKSHASHGKESSSSSEECAPLINDALVEGVEQDRISIRSSSSASLD
ncbi:hypothetical protein FDZ58_02110 [Ehrlichia ruminantium]|uniref:Uncharacterized protein n=2 Tax=Ehrlichia ruminantium TaxID=779 RepID=A0A0H3M132_EHRRW|nr:hypothetical protein FDZ61_02120 [Ehrlichia ruminantium]QLK58716.1 hypothetical protein FDZ58_02110 [Ehrlichia ruminantium]UOE00070.1 hypothetical protein IMW62_02115 [Ehrlichia ruminantium]CAI26882.1 Hypothetical protein ERWE_CDS_03880 [Ehrlichia ruminantium str. Welgevonden]